MEAGRNAAIKSLSVVFSVILLAVLFVPSVFSGGYGKSDASGTMYVEEEEVTYGSGCDEEVPAYVPPAPAPVYEPEPVVREIEPADQGEFPQQKLAKMLARVLGLEDRLPAAVSADDYFNLLTVVGIAPLDGWEIDAPVTRDDLAVVMVQALGLQGEVEDTWDPICYLDVLRSEGVDLAKGAFGTDHALSFPTVVNSFDALKFGNTVSDNFMTSLSPIGTSTGY